MSAPPGHRPSPEPLEVRGGAVRGVRGDHLPPSVAVRAVRDLGRSGPRRAPAGRRDRGGGHDRPSGAQPTEFDWWVERAGAYDVALVEIAAGVRVTLQGTEAPVGTLRRGAIVGTMLRRLFPMEGEWRYGRKAAPISLTPWAAGSPVRTAP